MRGRVGVGWTPPPGWVFDPHSLSTVPWHPPASPPQPPPSASWPSGGGLGGRGLPPWLLQVLAGAKGGGWDPRRDGPGRRPIHVTGSGGYGPPPTHPPMLRDPNPQPGGFGPQIPPSLIPFLRGGGAF